MLERLRWSLASDRRRIGRRCTTSRTRGLVRLRAPAARPKSDSCATVAKRCPIASRATWILLTRDAVKQISDDTVRSGRVMKSVYDERRSSDSWGALDEGDSQPRLMREQTKTCIDW